MDRKALIEKKKKQLHFKNLMGSMRAITTIEIYEAGAEKEFYKKIMSSYYELWRQNKLKPCSKLTCESKDNELSDWILTQVGLSSKIEYIFINSGYGEVYAKIILNHLSESILELWYHEAKSIALRGSLKDGFSKGFCLIDPLNKRVIEVALVSDDEYNYQLWQWYYEKP